MKRGELADCAESYIRDIFGIGVGDAIKIDKVIASARGRFLGVGAEQYQISENEQSFERSTVGTMLVGLDEELVDQINYAVMIDILVDRRLRQLGDSKNDRDVRIALALLRDELINVTISAANVSAALDWHVNRLVKFGEYERRPESDYVSQLQAECEATGATTLGLTTDGAELSALEAVRVAVHDKNVTPDALAAAIDSLLVILQRPPVEESDLDAAVGALDLNTEFVGIPADEYRAGVAYIEALEDFARDQGVLAEVRADFAGDERFDEAALEQWFTDGGGD